MMKKKLIEVAIPLEAINRESAREKSIRHGHPSTLHLWWARRPLAACRAVLFASLVDDPSSHLDRFPTEADQERERQRLFALIEELIKWENSNNEEVLARARKEILDSTDGNPPPIYDPFCGGGSIPLEAQRLGLKAYASDLNPVAVLITKAMIEIPPKFKDRPPVHPNQEPELIGRQWRRAEGLAEDIRYYGRWMRDEAFKRIGHLYPTVQLPAEQGGGQATVIAWLWARTVTCPNPACQVEMPLISSFWLSKKKGREAWIEPVVDRSVRPARISFRVQTGSGKPQESIKIGRGAQFRCLACGTATQDHHIKKEGMNGRMGQNLMAIVAAGARGRIYFPPSHEHIEIALSAQPQWIPEGQIAEDRRWFSPPLFGLTHFHHLFTARQLVALTTFSDLVGETKDRVQVDAVQAGLLSENESVEADGTNASAYAEAVATYLAFGVDRSADYWSTITTWEPNGLLIGHTFVRQAIPMVLDYAEANPFSNASGNFLGAIEWIYKVVESFPARICGLSVQKDAMQLDAEGHAFATDPPYYDNIGYADLSDYFYIWLRKSLNGIYDELFATMLVPKLEELVATPYRFNGEKRLAKSFFEKGMRQSFGRIHMMQEPDYLLTIYYAFKQAESTVEELNGAVHIVSTGWETMLEALLNSGFGITGTWPLRTERMARSVAIGTNALASSIVLSCRKRPETAVTVTRRDFVLELKQELPSVLRTLQYQNIAPVDLAQAAIGPGIAIFSRYSKVVEADGSDMKVRMALALINQVLDEVLTEQEGEIDPDTRWAVAWFQQFGMKEGPFGEAETLSKAKVVSVHGLVEAGIVTARGGKVQLLSRNQLPGNWDPNKDTRLTVWEITQHLIRALEKQGEDEAALLLKTIGVRAEAARDLSYRLYSICERRGWAEEATAYNSLITAWPEMSRLSLSMSAPERQRELGM
jgi:putative DNA methylase